MSSYGPSRHVVGVCQCKRCRGLDGAKDGVPFEPGNEMSLRHGALVSARRLASDPETVALAHEVRHSMPSYSESDEPTVWLYAIAVRRVQRATEAIEKADEIAAGRPLAGYLADSAP